MKSHDIMKYPLFSIHLKQEQITKSQQLNNIGISIALMSYRLCHETHTYNENKTMEY